MPLRGQSRGQEAHAIDDASAGHERIAEHRHPSVGVHRQQRPTLVELKSVKIGIVGGAGQLPQGFHGKFRVDIEDKVPEAIEDGFALVPLDPAQDVVVVANHDIDPFINGDASDHLLVVGQVEGSLEIAPVEGRDEDVRTPPRLSDVLAHIREVGSIRYSLDSRRDPRRVVVLVRLDIEILRAHRSQPGKLRTGLVAVRKHGGVGQVADFEAVLLDNHRLSRGG